MVISPEEFIVIADVPPASFILPPSSSIISPSIVKFRIVPRSLELSRTRALLAAAVPGVTLSSTPISAVVIVVESSVNEVSAVIVPVIARFPELVIAPQPIVPKPLTFPLVSNV